MKLLLWCIHWIEKNEGARPEVFHVTPENYRDVLESMNALERIYSYNTGEGRHLMTFMGVKIVCLGPAE